ncbi:carboxymuconolactone decarboxylase family protein [Motiliproteus sp. SC1-56]|uniref:carboxymuconolactone decarboxylase family protein n=1 Tax=Motiliproteus sp. SC1-56 TaxID=2799565 RepID=UPI001A8EA7A8|nr:carboxymuconolactone decarboxylase family protein [Motiliproteus sp. SC1-56]
MESEKFKKGLKVRRKVMGDEYVDRALNSATAFTRPLQTMVTENAWGGVWSEGVIPDKTRSLVTVAILASLKASAELRGHVLGALRNGCTAEEIQDVLLHCTVYCGAPAGIEAFRVANEVIADWESNPHNG